jgi:hypothetical protein
MVAAGMMRSWSKWAQGGFLAAEKLATDLSSGRAAPAVFGYLLISIPGFRVELKKSAVREGRGRASLIFT